MQKDEKVKGVPNANIYSKILRQRFSNVACVSPAWFAKTRLLDPKPRVVE